jgi:CYTH domain-containing protein
VEIERKYLIPEIPSDLAPERSRRIRQGYIATSDVAEVRIRAAGDDHTLTVKSRGGIARVEVELELSQDQFEDLWPLTEGRRLTKTRHEVPIQTQHVAEVDVYEDSLTGLAVAEVEFADLAAAEAFTPPEWFGVEITTDVRYRNEALARAPEPP